MFKFRDVVECIDNNGVSAVLTRGNHYTVSWVDSLGQIYLDGFFDTFSSSRFRLVPPTEKAPEPIAWPLVPVDPTCIPDGWRAVAVTRNLAGKYTSDAVQDLPKKWTNKSTFPRLVVERIMPPLAKPEFPDWLNPDWWIAMDKLGTWCVYPSHPAKHPSCFEWHGDVTLALTNCHYTDSMRRVPPNRWDEACWKIGGAS